VRSASGAGAIPHSFDENQRQRCLEARNPANGAAAAARHAQQKKVLTDRILAAASCHRTATRHELIIILVEDQALPPDTRIAIARKNDRPRATTGAARGAKTEATTFATLDLLLSIAKDAAATPAERRKAAAQLAEYFLPKNPRGRNRRRGRFPKDEYGFGVDPVLALELRDSKLRLDCLSLSNKLTPYNVAQRARKNQARIRAIQQSLECPCPSKYGVNEFKRDKSDLTVLVAGGRRGRS
jgi:hypothetical protein